MTSIENRKPVTELADALREAADLIDVGQMPGVRRRDARVIARTTREDAEVVELALNDAWTEMQTEVGASRGEALLWRAVVLDLIRAYNIPDIGEHLEHNGIPGCEDCGGILPLGDGRTFCDHCQATAEAEALAIAKPIPEDWRKAAMGAAHAGHWGDALAAARIAAALEAAEAEATAVAL